MPSNFWPKLGELKSLTLPEKPCKLFWKAALLRTPKIFPLKPKLNWPGCLHCSRPTPFTPACIPNTCPAAWPVFFRSALPGIGPVRSKPPPRRLRPCFLQGASCGANPRLEISQNPYPMPKNKKLCFAECGNLTSKCGQLDATFPP